MHCGKAYYTREQLCEAKEKECGLDIIETSLKISKLSVELCHSSSNSGKLGQIGWILILEYLQVWLYSNTFDPGFKAESILSKSTSPISMLCTGR